MKIVHEIHLSKIYPFEDDALTHITVSRPEKNLSATIYFPMFGGQDATAVAQYAQALLVASRLCADFNGEVWPAEAQWDYKGEGKNLAAVKS